MEPSVRDSLEDLMIALSRLTVYVFDTPQRLTTVNENLHEIQDALERVAERLGYPKSPPPPPAEPRSPEIMEAFR